MAALLSMLQHYSLVPPDETIHPGRATAEMRNHTGGRSRIRGNLPAKQPAFKTGNANASQMSQSDCFYRGWQVESTPGT